MKDKKSGSQTPGRLCITHHEAEETGSPAWASTPCMLMYHIEHPHSCQSLGEASHRPKSNPTGRMTLALHTHPATVTELASGKRTMTVAREIKTKCRFKAWEAVHADRNEPRSSEAHVDDRRETKPRPPQGCVQVDTIQVSPNRRPFRSTLSKVPVPEVHIECSSHTLKSHQKFPSHQWSLGFCAVHRYHAVKT